MRNPDTTAQVGADPARVETWFEAHGDLVHDQVGWRLRATAPGPDPNITADVVHDTFMIALEARRPPGEDAAVRPWILAIARNECLRVLRSRGPAAALSRPGTAPARSGESPSAADLRGLVGWAAVGLDARGRELLELGVRHGLPASEVGLVLGMAPVAAATALDRLRREFGFALGALVLACSGTAGCGGLRRLVQRWDGSRSPAWRRRLLRHVDGCGRCSPERPVRVDATAILRLPPLVTAPAPVARWVLADAADPALAAERAALARRAGPWDAAGFPVPIDR